MQTISFRPSLFAGAKTVDRPTAAHILRTARRRKLRPSWYRHWKGHGYRMLVGPFVDRASLHFEREV